MSNGNDRSKRMSAFTLRVEKDLINEAKDKAGIVPISRIIRILLKKWLKGEIQIDYSTERD
jgi:hypothetical protein